MKESAVYEIRLKDSFSAGLRNIERETDTFESKLKDVGGTIASVFAISRLVDFGKESVRTIARMDSLRNAIVFASGSSEDGAKNLQYLDNISKDLGFNLASTIEGFKTFSGALIGSKFEGEKARDIFTKISYGISAMGLDAESAKGAFLALGQMVSKGTVSAEELRGQLGERLPGAFQIAARAMGVTTKQLGDMLKDGAVVTDEFLPKFADEMEKTFKGAIGKSSQSLQADLNRLDNIVHEVTEGVGFYLSPVVRILAHETKSANEQFKEQKAAFDNLSMSAKPLMDRYTTLRAIANRTKEEQEELKKVTNDLSVLMPSAVTAWDAYGNAIELSSKRMRDHVKYSKEAMMVLNAQAIRETEEQLLQARRNVMAIQNELKETAKTGRFGNWNQEESNDAIAWLRGNLEIEQQKQKDLQRKYLSLKGGVSEEQRHEELMEGIKKRNLLFKGLSPSAADSAGKNTTKSKGTAGIEKIASGTRNITVNINKLVETITFQKMDGQNESRLQEMIKKALITAVNDVNIVAQ
jgi:tape measure domain-containing protein